MEKVIGLSKQVLKSIPTILNRISQQLENIETNNRSEGDIAVLWDVENVNPGNDASFIEGFSEYLVQYGRVIVAQAFADWTRKPVSHIASLLSEHHFELIHVPAAKKNSADMSLITYGIELALKYPNITTFVLVTGDSDFRSLVKSLRRNGKKIIIVCDVNTARPDFLILADSFKDFRTLRPGGMTANESKEEEEEQPPILEKASSESVENEQQKAQDIVIEQKTNAYSLLTEAIIQMKKEGLKPGMGMVKVRLLMLNPDFNEKSLGFNNWNSFINDAQEAGAIHVRGKVGGLLLDVVKPAKEKTDQDKAFEMLLAILRKCDGQGKAKFHNLSIIAGELYKQKKFKKLKKKLGFKKFKDFIQAAEVRKLVETEVDGLTHSVKRFTK